jgi:hypothetical protein
MDITLGQKKAEILASGIDQVTEDFLAYDIKYIYQRVSETWGGFRAQTGGFRSSALPRTGYDPPSWSIIINDVPILTTGRWPEVPGRTTVTQILDAARLAFAALHEVVEVFATVEGPSVYLMVFISHEHYDPDLMRRCCEIDQSIEDRFPSHSVEIDYFPLAFLKRDEVIPEGAVAVFTR